MKWARWWSWAWGAFFASLACASDPIEAQSVGGDLGESTSTTNPSTTTGQSTNTGTSSTSDSGSPTSTTTSSSTDAGTTPTDDTGTGTGTTGGGSGLVDTGLVVRYFIDEASAGSLVTELLDAGPGTPLDLPIMYVSQQPQFTLSNQNRGLRWSEAGADGRPMVAIDATKVEDAFDGSTTATIELVVDVAALSSDGSRFVHFGGGGEVGDFSLRAFPPDLLRLAVDGNDVVQWTIAVQGRTVFHLVYDSAQANEDDRARLYVQGTLVPPDNGSLLQDEPIVLEDNDDLVLGNRSDGHRSFGGVLHYAALYSAPLTSVEVANNADVLGDSDDQ